VRVGLIILALLTGCATQAPPQPKSVSLAELKAVKLSSRDCPYIDQRVKWAENQLRLRGTFYANPEDLHGEDREFNATARIQIWSLRIGCANPDRYAKK
jgi:hypothetical protein